MNKRTVERVNFWFENLKAVGENKCHNFVLVLRLQFWAVYRPAFPHTIFILAICNTCTCILDLFDSLKFSIEKIPIRNI